MIITLSAEKIVPLAFKAILDFFRPHLHLCCSAPAIPDVTDWLINGAEKKTCTPQHPCFPPCTIREGGLGAFGAWCGGEW